MIKNSLYRPEIDGLRAISVLAVIFYHAGFSGFEGGFAGVDVFFVISGYLITQILYKSIDSGSWSFKEFYSRRFRRLLPALYTILAVSSFFAYLWMTPLELVAFAESVASNIAFASNIYFWRTVNYFDPAADLKPLLHTWSLAVEEQYYFFYPLLLLLSKKLKKEWRPWLLGSIALFSYLLCEWGWRAHPLASFNLLPTRGWEMLIGGIFATLAPVTSSNSRNSNFLSLLGLTLIFYSFFTFDHSTPFPSHWALFPTLGTALILRFSSKENICGKFLSIKPFVGIGLVSYSLYLLHQPVFVFFKMRLTKNPTTTEYTLLIVLSLIVAIAMWKFIEQPFRNKKNCPPRVFIPSLSVVCVVLIIFSTHTLRQSGIPGRFTAKSQIILNQIKNHYDKSTCEFSLTSTLEAKNICQWGRFKNNVAVWGDSHTRLLSPTLATQLSFYDFGVKSFTHSACLPAPGFKRRHNWSIQGESNRCDKFNTFALNSIISDPSIEIVLLHGRFTLAFEGSGFDNMEGGREKIEFQIEPLEGKDSYSAEDSHEEWLGALLENTVMKLLESGKKVVILYPVPEAGWSVGTHLVRESKLGKERTTHLTTSYDVFLKRQKKTYSQLDRISDNVNLTRVFPEEALCDSSPNGKCFVHESENLLYYDTNHLTELGISKVVPLIKEKLIQKRWIKAKVNLARIHRDTSMAQITLKK